MEIHTGQFVATDGTRLTYQKVGEGPPIILANGLGGIFLTWKHLCTHLARHHTVISWDYRGLYDSEAPADPTCITVAHHADDLLCLLDHLNIKRAVVVGWSMGVQVNFELYKRHPERFAGLCVINGTAGRTFETVRGGALSSKLLPAVLERLAERPQLVSKTMLKASAWDGAVAMLKRVGMIAPTLDEEIFSELAQAFARLDFRIYLKTLQHLGYHDAWDVLPRVAVPTTIIAGGKDLMTPIAAAQRMCQLIPDARLVVLPGSSHYAPVEQPAIINAAIDKLLHRSGYQPQTAHCQ